MGKKRIRIGVAGLGRIGWNYHCRAIGASKDFTLAAVADPELERLAEAEVTHDCRTFETTEAMIAEADLDVVVLATPTHMHKAHALAAFKKGLHVFLEKPMAMNVAEAEAILKASKRAKRILTIYQPRRADAPFQQMLKLIADGAIGEVYQVRLGSFNFCRRNDWQALRKFGGGMLNNYGAHYLDRALVITGRDVKKVYCSLRRVATMGDADDVVKVVYETRGGKVGEVEINQACVGRPFELEAIGTTGVIAKEGNTLKVTSFDASKLAAKELNADLASADRQYPRDQFRIRERTVKVNPRFGVDVYKDLARAIRTGTPPFVDPAETISVMKLMARCREEAGRILDTRI